MSIANLLTLCLAASPLIIVGSEQIIPTAPGTTWRYQMTQEMGEGVRLSELKPDADGKFRTIVVYRINGTRNLDGKELLEFEMHRAGRVTNIDLLTVDEHGIICPARVDQDGELIKLDPPQTIMAAPIKPDQSWDFDGEVSGAKVHQHFRVVGQEDVQVAAGKFHAFRVEGEQTIPNHLKIDRWFVPGTGIVKDVTTAESAEGDLIRRISLELTETPQVGPRPEVKPPAPAKKLEVTVGKDPVGAGTSTFLSGTPKIYARWQGHDLREQASIRAVWIAEDVGDAAPADSTIDEATATATAPDSHGIFTLSRPENGWTPGVYRVEFYVDNAFMDAVKLKIQKVGAAAF